MCIRDRRDSDESATCSNPYRTSSVKSLKNDSSARLFIDDYDFQRAFDFSKRRGNKTPEACVIISLRLDKRGQNWLGERTDLPQCFGGTNAHGIARIGQRARQRRSRLPRLRTKSSDRPGGAAPNEFVGIL